MTKAKKNKAKVVILKNGPYFVSGNLPLGREIIVFDDEGNSVEWKKGKKYPNKKNYGLCRCGHSINMPYCDGTHSKIGFDGTEIATPKSYIGQAEEIGGPGLILTDVPELCASARFCHNKKGNTWNLTRDSDHSDKKEEAIKQAKHCPSGRLIVWNKKTKKPIEPKFKPSIGLIEDSESRAFGPIYLKGGIELEGANGKKYETRNRITLCRCGKSRNKPFCDGSHMQ